MASKSNESKWIPWPPPEDNTKVTRADKVEGGLRVEEPTTNRVHEAPAQSRPAPRVSPPQIVLEARPTELHTIWINEQWRINVDGHGYLAVPHFEGALGCVIQLLPADGGDNRLALKIPRLLADTVRENAFINQIVEGEAEIVVKANERLGLHSGLIPVQLAQCNLLRGPRQLRNSPIPEAIAQEGCVLFVSFTKDGGPRICSVRFDDDAELPTVFPPAAAEDLSFLTRELWDHLRRPVMGGAREFHEPTFFEVRPSPDTTTRLVKFGRLVESMDIRRAHDLWYAAIPSILYNWASGTLQEAVSCGRHRDWSLVEHYDLIGGVLRGLVTLHSRGLIHGDVRPANVMALGDPSRSSDYALGDYGSFSSDKARLGASAEAASGHTMTGAGVSRLRTSVFYSSERRAGTEREAADTAIVLTALPDGRNDEYFVRLGWRSALVDPITNRPLPETLEQMRGDWVRMRALAGADARDALTSDKLCRGDRLRVRDYIFTVIDSDTSSGRTNFRCQRRFARVLHERIAVYNQDSLGIADATVISVPVYTEIRQWSAATDLYGVGALALYTVFTSGLSKLHDSERPMPHGSVTPGREHDAGTSAETMLAEMIEMLESVPHFLYLWPDLEDFRATIEGAEHHMSSEDVARLPVTRHNNTPLVVFATQVVNNLLRGSPHVDTLLHCFVSERPRGDMTEYNVAHFLLFIHFVMSCLHRKTDLWRGNDTDDVNDEWLFCADRCEVPLPEGAAKRALDRLVDLQLRASRRDYGAFSVPADQFLKFDPRSDFQIRVELERLRAEIQRRDAYINKVQRKAEMAEQSGLFRRRQHFAELLRSLRGGRDGGHDRAGGRDGGARFGLTRALQSSWAALQRMARKDSRAPALPRSEEPPPDELEIPVHRDAP